jgi:hypothetical protein
MLDFPLSSVPRGDCPNIGSYGSSPEGLPPANWVELKQGPMKLARGQDNRIGVKYNLATLNKAFMTLSLMTWNWNTHETFLITTVEAPITAAEDFVQLTLPIPRDAEAGPDGMYLIAYFTPASAEGDYAHSLAEDRKYKVQWSMGEYNPWENPREVQIPPVPRNPWSDDNDAKGPNNRPNLRPPQQQQPPKQAPKQGGWFQNMW